MTSNIPLSGKHQRKNLKFYSQDCKFLLCSRSKTTPSKPALFLIAKPIIKALKKDVYISSLYPVAQNLFELEYGGKRYTLKLASDWVTITPINVLKTV